MTLDPKIVVMANDQIVLAFEDRDEHVAQESRKCVNDLARRGMLNSGVAIHQLGRLYATELKIRAEIALGSLRRVFETVAPELYEGLAHDLRHFLHEKIDRQAALLRDKLASSPIFKGSASTIMKGHAGQSENMLAQAIDYARMRASSEIDIYVAGLEQRASQASTKEASGVVVHGTVGSIQTGPFATANVSMSIDASTKEELQRGLSELAEQIQVQGVDRHFNAKEVAELIQDCLAEVRKDKPNTTKLRSFVNGISTAIQTSAALRPAYETIMSVARAIGAS